MYRVLKLSVWVMQATALGTLTRRDADLRARKFANYVLSRAEVDLQVSGGDEVLRDRPFVYMSNHQSMFDIPVLWAALPAESLRFVAKTELFKTPVWGQAMRAGEIIEVDRRNREQAIDALERGAEMIRSGVSVWIAPEGHRSDSGRLGPLKKGGFHLAKNAGVDIVPVAINGTINVLPPHELKVRKRQRVEVIIGEPIAVADHSIEELMEHVGGFLGERVDENVRVAS